jgi:SAM-dependent methyltransferase
LFSAYSRMARSVGGLDAAPEWPAVRQRLPDLAGLRVLDLGCGFGWFSRWARSAGAKSVLGVDVSAKMLARARSETHDAAVEYRLGDLETLELPAAAFDFAYSSLAFHYVAAFGRLAKLAHAALNPGARLVFSQEHPIFTAPQSPGWARDAQARRSWALNSYGLEGARTTDWLAPGVVKQHRTMGTILNTLIDAGFAIRHVEDWRPSAEQIAAAPALCADELDRPMFLIVEAQR